MTTIQNDELQAIIQRFEVLETDEIESAFIEYWKPFILSLESEEDRMTAFKIFYEWQTARLKTLSENIIQRSKPAIASP